LVRTELATIAAFGKRTPGWLSARFYTLAKVFQVVLGRLLRGCCDVVGGLYVVAYWPK